jgi:hypothetical protein
MPPCTRRPGQFRLPAWAHEFLAEEADRRGVSKTEVVLLGLEALRAERLEGDLIREYAENAATDAAEAAAWEPTASDGLEAEKW